MGLFISNLYNFYQFADFQVKKSFLDLLSKYILRFEKELLVSLSAFVLCIIPALDDQNDEMVTKIHQILNRTEKIVGTSKLFGEIWKTMLRSPRSRLTAIKYLDTKIPRNIEEAAELNKSEAETRPLHKKGQIYLSKYNLVVTGGKMIVEKCDYDQDAEKHDDKDLPQWARKELDMLKLISQSNPHCNMDKQFKNNQLDDKELEQRRKVSHALQYFYYPNRPNLVINAILSGLHTRENSLVVRATFDFLISHVQIDSDLIEDEERIRLVEGSLLTLMMRDFASHRKFFNWFLAHLDDLDETVKDDDPAVVSCVEAYKRILKRFENEQLSGKKPIGTSMGDFSIKQPIMILATLFRDDEMFEVRSLILQDITESLIKYILLVQNSSMVSAKEFERFKQETEPLFEMIRDEQESVWSALATLLQSQIEGLEDGEHEFKIEAIDLIMCALTDLLK